MSAFVVGDGHLHFLLTAALDWDRPGHGPLRWEAPGEDGAADFRRGAAWGPTAIETALRRGRELTRATADAVGAMLKAQNLRSVNHRYGRDAGEAAPYVYRRSGHPADPVAVLKALDCYEYQSSEDGGWEASEALAFCEALRHRAVGRLPGYEAAPWEVR